MGFKSPPGLDPPRRTSPQRFAAGGRQPAPGDLPYPVRRSFLKSLLNLFGLGSASRFRRPWVLSRLGAAPLCRSSLGTPPLSFLPLPRIAEPIPSGKQRFGDGFVVFGPRGPGTGSRAGSSLVFIIRFDGLDANDRRAAELGRAGVSQHGAGRQDHRRLGRFRDRSRFDHRAPLPTVGSAAATAAASSRRRRFDHRGGCLRCGRRRFVHRRSSCREFGHRDGLGFASGNRLGMSRASSAVSTPALRLVRPSLRRLPDSAASFMSRSAGRGPFPGPPSRRSPRWSTLLPSLNHSRIVAARPAEIVAM